MYLDVVLSPGEHYLHANSVDCLTLRPRAHTLKLFEHCRCSLIHAFQAVTKDHESVLRKQQEDIGYLSRHLDHVINFTKWATARNGGTALLYCKRLVRLDRSFVHSALSHHLVFPYVKLGPESRSGGLDVMKWEHMPFVIHKCPPLKNY